MIKMIFSLYKIDYSFILFKFPSRLDSTFIFPSTCFIGDLNKCAFKY
jgi:hypothetical protein